MLCRRTSVGHTRQRYRLRHKRFTVHTISQRIATLRKALNSCSSLLFPPTRQASLLGPTSVSHRRFPLQACTAPTPLIHTILLHHHSTLPQQPAHNHTRPGTSHQASLGHCRTADALRSTMGHPNHNIPPSPNNHIHRIQEGSPLRPPQHHRMRPCTASAATHTSNHHNSRWCSALPFTPQL